MESIDRPFLLWLNLLSLHLWFRSWWGRSIFWCFWCDFSFGLNDLWLLIWNNIFNIFIVMSIFIIQLWLFDLLLVNFDCFLLSFLKTDLLWSFRFLFYWLLFLKTDRFTSIFLNHDSRTLFLNFLRLFFFSVLIIQYVCFFRSLNLGGLRNYRLFSILGVNF